MTQDLQKLRHSVKHVYVGMECVLAEWVALPVWRMTTDVWATEKTGPRQLDDIFFGLLQNGVNTREEIARRLGVDQDEFVLTHLDILVREGYVSHEQGVYDIAEKGRLFVRRDFLEDGLKKEKFSFNWCEAGAHIIGPDIQVVSDSKDGRKIKHGTYAEDKLLDALPEHFNASKREENVVFYDIDSSARGHPFFKKERVYAEYAALFYTPVQGEDEWCVDLRVRNLDVRDDFGEREFPKHEELTRIVNKEEDWRNKFGKIYAEFRKAP